MPVVFIPGKGNVRFPDDMTPYQIQLAIEREILPGRKPETISAPKQPEGGFLNAIKGISAEIAAIPSATREMVKDVFGTPGKAVESVATLGGIGGIPQTLALAAQNKIFDALGVGAPPPPPKPRAPSPRISEKIDEALGLTSPQRRAEEARRAAIYGPLATRGQQEMEAATARTRADLAAPQFDSLLASGLYSGAASLAQMTPGLIASAATRNPIPALANITAITAGPTYQKYKERGATPTEALLGTVAETGIELGTEALPLGVLVNKLGKVGFSRFLKEYLGRELPSELIATITQNAVDTAVANPDKTWGEYASSLPRDLAETAVATIVPGAALATAGKGMQIASRLAERGASEDEVAAALQGATTEAGAPRTAPRPSPPPVDMDTLSKSLGPVGGKITIQEPTGPQEYTYQGLDEDGSVLLVDADGEVFAEDPDQVAAALQVGAVEPEEGLGGMAFGMDITEGLEEPAAAEREPVVEPGLAPMTIQTLPQQLLMAAREQPGGLIPAGSLSQPEVMALEEAGISKNENGDYEAYPLIDEADRRYKIGELDNSMSQYDNSHISGLQQRYGIEAAPAAPTAPAAKEKFTLVTGAEEESAPAPAPAPTGADLPLDEGIPEQLKAMERSNTPAVMASLEKEARQIAADEGASSVSAAHFAQALNNQATRTAGTEVPFAGDWQQATRPAPAPERVRTVTTPGGSKVSTAFEVVDAKDLTAATGDLQNRDRSRAATDLQVQDIFSNFDPERLGESLESDRGSPIIGPDNVVESGNGRVMAINKVYDESPDRADAYRKFIEAQGFDTSGYERPVLVRRRIDRLTPEERTKFVRESNMDTKLQLSTSERAQTDAASLTPDVMGLMVSPDVSAAANQDFVRGFLSKLPTQEQAAFLDKNGRLSAEGIRRLRTAVKASAYGDADLINTLDESQDNNIKSIGGALEDVAPAWRRFRDAVQEGDVTSDMDVTENLVDAAKIVRDVRNQGMKINDFLAQQDAFNPLDPVTERFIRSFYNQKSGRASGREAIADVLEKYARRASEQTTTEGLFEREPVSPADILDGIMEGSEQGGLFDNGKGVENNAQVMEVLNTGTPDQMKNAIAQAQKPNDKIIQEGANLQKKNRGCD